MPRYAIYCLPEGRFGAEGATWLGWDAAAGRALPVPPERAPWVATPRRYGFHATLKPPFRLAEDANPGDLGRALARLAARIAPARADGLEAVVLDGFVAFRPRGASSALADVAARCLVELDAFRAPAPPEELARRRAAGLSPRQEAMLQHWGYPYVLDEFQFHVTLSGRVEDAPAVLRAAKAHFSAPPAPFMLDAIALCEEREGMFRLRHRYPLTGTSADSPATTA
jgi:hypothetical protein